MPLVKKPNYIDCLMEFLSANSSNIFCYGLWDCTIFVAKAIEAMTGQDEVAVMLKALHEPKRFRMEVGELPLAAALYLGKSIPDGMDPVQFILETKMEEFEAQEIDANHIQRGDICLIPSPTGPTGGVFNGRHIVTPDDQCYRRVSQYEAIKIWRL